MTAVTELARRLGEHVEAARAAWPEIEIGDDDVAAWAAYVAARVPAGVAPADAIAKMHVADLWAACACAAGREPAILAVRARCFADLAPALHRLGASTELVDEVCAELASQLFVGAAPRIATYAGRGALRSWVRSAAIRTALKRLGARRGFDDDAVLDAFAHPDEDPTLALLKREYRDEVRAAFQAALADLAPRERNVLRQHYLDELDIDRLGRMYNVHRATAARWIAGARDALLAGTRARLAARLGLAETEVDSIIGLVHSQLEVSFARLVT